MGALLYKQCSVGKSKVRRPVHLCPLCIFACVMKMFVLTGITVSSFVLSFATQAVGQTSRITADEYIMTYKEVAITEMKLYKVPASITLAQGMLESDYGNSVLARKANNHFGIKCKAEWTGGTFLQDDDEKSECFRKYNTAWESYRDHSIFLSTRSYYTSLFKLDITDYKAWAKGLKAAGYATNPYYAESLIRLIEDYKLYRFDRPADSSDLPVDTNKTVVEVIPVRVDTTLQRDTALSKVDPDTEDFQSVTPGESKRDVFSVNGVRFILAKADDNYRNIAFEYGMEENDLLRFNDLKKSRWLNEGDRVFIEIKKEIGPVDSHTVQAGETMYGLSQYYGIKLMALYSKNHMKKGTEPVVGQHLYLQQNAPIY